MASVSSEDGDALSLNVMPMLDIFSILILFLLINFSTDPVNHDLNAAIELPDSATITSLDEVPTVVVSRNDIMVNDKQIATLQDGDVVAQQTAQGAIQPLYDELMKVLKANKRFDGRGKDKKVRTLTIEADKTHNFKLLKRVMLSAQQTEFVTFKLMVAKNQ